MKLTRITNRRLHSGEHLLWVSPEYLLFECMVVDDSNNKIILITIPHAFMRGMSSGQRVNRDTLYEWKVQHVNE